MASATADMAEIARRLAASGLVDFLSIIGGGAHTYELQAAAVPNMSYTTGVFLPLAAAIKQAVPGHADLPREPHRRSRSTPTAPWPAGQVDVVGMTRALIADPDLPAKRARDDSTTSARAWERTRAVSIGSTRASL